MKKLILAATAVCFMASFAQADIALVAPLDIGEVKVATKVKILDYKHDVYAKEIQAEIFYYTAADSPVKHYARCTIKNIPDTVDELGTVIPGVNHYNHVVNDVIETTHVGKKKSVAWINRIQNKCKNLLNIDGIED